MNIKDNLRGILKSNGIKQTWLVEQSGISQSAITAILSKTGSRYGYIHNNWSKASTVYWLTYALFFALVASLVLILIYLIRSV